MGLIKPNNYNKEEITFARIADALSHPARTRIIELIQEENIVTQTSLVSHLNLNRTSVNRHINNLRRANLLLNKYRIHYEILHLNEETFLQFEKRLQKLSNSYK
ncbi:Helix-turn-helix domain protein [compost metagenome]